MTTNRILGQGNAVVYEGFDLRPEGNGQALAVKTLLVSFEDKRLTLMTLKDVEHELRSLAVLKAKAPDAPISYPITHST